jgi:hypothetical protein
MRRHRVALAQSALLIVFITSTGLSSAQARDAFVGTWHLNPTKSTFGNPAAPPKASTLRIEAAVNGHKMVVDNVGPSGRPITYQFTAAFDGKDYPLDGMDGTVALKRVDARTIERTHKNDGVITLVFTTRLSADGRTLTLTQTGQAEGRAVKNVLVYDKK